MLADNNVHEAISEEDQLRVQWYLLLGRLLHAYGVSRPREDFRFRVTGMVLTFTVLLSSASGILTTYAGWTSA